MSIKTDNTATLVNALAEIDRLKAAIKELLDEDPVFILRKQAEALDSVTTGDECPLWFDREYVRVDSVNRCAQRLRQQADELESNNAQEH